MSVASSMTITRAVIVHGFAASPSDHWFDWLKETLESSGIAVQVPQLPEPTAPDVDRWVTTAVEAIGIPDAHTAIVTHSLGGVTALHALDQIGSDWQLGALVAVAGFTEPLAVLPQLDSFTATRPDVDRTAARTQSRAVLLSDNDTFVPASQTLALGHALHAEIVSVPGAGHFLADDGFAELPQAAQLLVNR